jgi:hypothetical protein
VGERSLFALRYTFEPQPVRAFWMHQGLRYEENNLRVFVDVEARLRTKRSFRISKRS